MQIKIPKRFGKDKADETKRRQREAMEDYFDSLQDKGYEVLDSRILTRVERLQLAYPVTWNGERYVIHINNNH